MASSCLRLRRRLAPWVLALLMPLACGLVYRAHGQWTRYQEAEALYLETERLMHGELYHPEAIRRLTRCIELSPDLYAAWDSLAHYQALEGRFGESEATLRMALGRMPDRWELHRSLAILYFRQARYADAIEELKLAPHDEFVDHLAGLANLGLRGVPIPKQMEALVPFSRDHHHHEGDKS